MLQTFHRRLLTPICLDDFFKLPILNQIAVVEPYRLIADLAKDIVRVRGEKQDSATGE